MKKKILSLLLAAAFAVAFAGLTACGNDDNDGYNGLKSEKIATAEAWAAAFDLSNVTNVRITSTNIETLDETDICDFDGGKVKEVWTRKVDGTTKEDVYYTEYKTNEIYNAVTDPDRGTEYRYTYDDTEKAWTVSRSSILDMETPETWFEEIGDILTGYDEQEDDYIIDIADRYADFTYDEKTYSYVSRSVAFGNWGTRNLKIYLKFKDGKIAEVRCRHERKDEEDSDVWIPWETTISLSNFGTTTVTLPTVGNN